MFGLGEIFEAMRAKVNERRIGWKISAYENARRVGDQNLPAVSDGHESGNPVNGRTEKIAAAFVGISGVYSHAHVDATNARMIFFGDSTLRFKRSRQGIGGAGEGNTKGIADRLEDISAVLFKLAAQQRIMTFDRDSHVVAMRLPTLRRAFNVGEEKSYSAGR
jgi:hypothetical protein